MIRKRIFNKGDKVRFLNEKGDGIVVRTTSEYVYVDVGNGFELPVLHADLIVMEPATLQNQKNEQQQTDDEYKTEEIVSKPLSKLGNKLPRGIYLAFAPVNQSVPVSGDILLYLINFTPISLMYSIFLQKGNTVENKYEGKIESASAVLLATIDRQETIDYQRGIFQCLFTDVMSAGIAEPLYSTFEIKQSRFLKEEMYVHNQAISMLSLTVQLFRAEEISYISVFQASGQSRTVSSSIIEEKALIDKYRTTVGQAEVDLHLDKIVKDTTEMKDAQKLKLQLDFCKSCLDSAIAESYKRVVFIHGVGVGILKMEITRLLQTYENIEYRDAPISQYGIGATEVVIHQS